MYDNLINEWLKASAENNMPFYDFLVIKKVFGKISDTSLKQIHLLYLKKVESIKENISHLILSEYNKGIAYEHSSSRIKK